MRWSRFRSTHVSLAVASVLLLLAVIGWLVSGDGARLRVGRLTAPAAPVVALPPTSSTPPDPGPPAPEGPGASMPHVAAVPVERFAIESGPFPSSSTADRFEAELNRLGHATVRFRKEDATRLFVVTATGFTSSDEARQLARELGRGTVLERAGIMEVVIGQHPSLGEAVAVARPLRARGLEVRVSEAVAPSVVYHVRYGQFDRRGDAQAFRESLALRGIHGRVVKVR